MSDAMKSLIYAASEGPLSRSQAEEAFEIPNRVGYPVVIRPSYVLGGRAMEIVRDDDHLARYIRDKVVEDSR